MRWCRRTAIYLQVFLPEIHPPHPHRLPQLAMIVHPADQTTPLEIGAKGVGRRRSDDPEHAPLVPLRQPLHRLLQWLRAPESPYLCVGEIVGEHHKLVGEDDITLPQLGFQPTCRAAEIETPSITVIGDEGR